MNRVAAPAPARAASRRAATLAFACALACAGAFAATATDGGDSSASTATAAATPTASTDAPAPVLRVCADPNNLPYSNAAGEGFENRIAALVAKDLGATVQYTWWAQRRGSVRNTIGAGTCDVVPGVPAGSELLLTTDPYYRSGYVFVSRRDRALGDLSSFDDPRLRKLEVGVQLVGDDGANTPPAHALARRGMTGNVRGYMVYGDYRDRAPQSAIVDAVARGDVDVAVAWGPTAGYFASRAPVPMRLVPVQPWLDGPQSPMVFDISMGVRRDDRELRRRLDAALAKEAPAIRRILAGYGVPVLDDAAPAWSSTTTSPSPGR